MDSQNDLSWRDSVQPKFGPLELKFARADADGIPLLLLGVEGAEAVDDHRALDEKPNRYCMVRGNVWLELINAGTVIQPMVSDMAP